MRPDAQLMRLLLSFREERALNREHAEGFAGGTRGLIGVTVWKTKYPCMDMARKPNFPVC